MTAKIGEQIYNTLTGEQGTIVRLVDETHYVVSLTETGESDGRESMWSKAQITDKPDNLPPWLRRH